MGLPCRIFGCTMVTTSKESVDSHEVRCEICGKVEIWNSEQLCENHKCEDFVVATNPMQSVDGNRQFSMRCYRCPVCGESWTDDSGEYLDGLWDAVGGKAIHRSEYKNILSKINNAVDTLNEADDNSESVTAATIIFVKEMKKIIDEQK